MEIWSGAEAFGSLWAFYTGLTYAPDGVTQPGTRFRVSAGMSSYTYTSALGEARAAQPFANLLAGYQWQIGTVTLKAFAGVTGHAEVRSLQDVQDLGHVSRFGAKGAIEAWWSINAQNWASLDIAYATSQASVWSRLRAGHRLFPNVSLGPEAGVSGEATRPGARVGAFARYDWAGGEIAVSGGWARDAIGSSIFAGSDGGRSGAYATLLWLQRY